MAQAGACFNGIVFGMGSPMRVPAFTLACSFLAAFVSDTPVDAAMPSASAQDLVISPPMDLSPCPLAMVSALGRLSVLRETRNLDDTTREYAVPDRAMSYGARVTRIVYTSGFHDFGDFREFQITVQGPWDPVSAQIAARHANSTCRNGIDAHCSGRTGPGSRLEAYRSGSEVLIKCYMEP